MKRNLLQVQSKRQKSGNFVSVRRLVEEFEGITHLSKECYTSSSECATIYSHFDISSAHRQLLRVFFHSLLHLIMFFDFCEKYLLACVLYRWIIRKMCDFMSFADRSIGLVVVIKEKIGRKRKNEKNPVSQFQSFTSLHPWPSACRCLF